MSRERPYEVLCTDSSPEWLELRKQYLTGSGVAAMFGEALYDPKTPEDYLRSKEPGYPPLVANRPMLHGSYDEAHNMRKFSHITGFRSRPCHYFMASKTFPGLAATIDGLVHIPQREPEIRHGFVDTDWPVDILTQAREAEAEGLGSIGLLEMKQTEAWSKKKWFGLKYEPVTEPMRHHWLQLQSQMHVTGHRWGILAGAIGAAMFKAFFVRRDDSDGFTEQLRDAAARVRDYVSL